MKATPSSSVSRARRPTSSPPLPRPLAVGRTTTGYVSDGQVARGGATAVTNGWNAEGNEERQQKWLTLRRAGRDGRYSRTSAIRTLVALSPDCPNPGCPNSESRKVPITRSFGCETFDLAIVQAFDYSIFASSFDYSISELRELSIGRPPIRRYFQLFNLFILGTLACSSSQSSDL